MFANKRFDYKKKRRTGELWRMRNEEKSKRIVRCECICIFKCIRSIDKCIFSQITSVILLSLIHRLVTATRPDARRQVTNVPLNAHCFFGSLQANQFKSICTCKWAFSDPWKLNECSQLDDAERGFRFGSRMGVGCPIAAAVGVLSVCLLQCTRTP